MTTSTREAGGTGGAGLLHRLHDAVGPFVIEAGRQDPPSLVRVLAGGHVFVDLIWPDGRTYRGAGTGAVGEAIAKAVGELAIAGLNRLPVDARELLVPLMEQAALIVEWDPLLGSANGSLEVSGHPPMALFTLQAGDVH